MNLSDKEKEQLKEWLVEGLSLSAIHKKVTNELGKKMTYMDLRFLIDDLELEFPKEEKKEGDDEKEKKTHEKELELVHGVSVEVDKIVRPGAVISGRVTFTDGQKAAWHLDQMGRIGLVPTTAGYQPVQEDIMAFQRELQQVIQQQGI